MPTTQSLLGNLRDNAHLLALADRDLCDTALRTYDAEQLTV